MGLGTPGKYPSFSVSELSLRVCQPLKVMCESGFGVKGGARNPRKAPFFLSLRAEFENESDSL